MSELNHKLSMLDGAIAAGRLQQALAYGSALTTEFPQVQHGWMSFSEACRLSGQLTEARTAAARAWQLGQSDLFAIAQYARCLMPFAEHRKLLELIRAALACDTSNEWALDTLAASAVSIDEWEPALDLYDRLALGQPDNVNYQYMRGLALSVLGRTAEAVAVLSEIRQHARVRGRVLNLLQDIDRQSVTESELETVINDQHSPAQEIMYALQARGRLQHTARRFPDAFRSWQQANELKTSGPVYKHCDWEALADGLMRIADLAGSRSAADGPSERRPIFIVGLPRSGTTLLERLLVSSGRVAALGELRDFEVVLQEQLGISISLLPFRLPTDNLRSPDWQHLGESYRNRLASRDSSRRRPCDKNPFNFLFCGLILSALPEAQIVHIKKHPLDAGLGNFRHLFAAAAPWSYRLADIAHFYSLYHRMMKHWALKFPDRIYQIEYEELVSDPLAQTRELYQWLDLPWTENVVERSTDTGVVRSASTNQVREPIHQNAVHTWRHYEKELAPLRELMVNAGIIEKDG